MSGDFFSDLWSEFTTGLGHVVSGIVAVPGTIVDGVEYVATGLAESVGVWHHDLHNSFHTTPLFLIPLDEQNESIVSPIEPADAVNVVTPIVE